jgi:damage-control phosphatase, subfamily I
MKTDLECIPCIINQCVTTLKLTNCDEQTKIETINELMDILKKIDLDLPPANNSDIVYSLCREKTSVADPYLKLKKKYNKLALEFFPDLKDLVHESKDRLYAAIKIAAGGNIIDFGINVNKGKAIDFELIKHEIENVPFAIDDYEKFKRDLNKAKKILYIADNAGEIFFDRILIKEIIKQNKNVVLVVKSGPIINDATMEDAVFAGLDNLVKIVESGSAKIGLNLDHLSEEFLKEYKDSDMIISKGQGNFETLHSIDHNIYYILKAKCEKIARELGVNYLDVVLVKRKPSWGSDKI